MSGRRPARGRSQRKASCRKLRLVDLYCVHNITTGREEKTPMSSFAGLISTSSSLRNGVLIGFLAVTFLTSFSVAGHAEDNVPQLGSWNVNLGIFSSILRRVRGMGP